MIVPSKNQKTYGVLHTENYFSFLGFSKKVNSNKVQKVDVFLDDILIDTIVADKHIEKIEDIYELEGFGFNYVLPNEYIGQKSLISFKNNETQENLQNSPYELIEKSDHMFNHKEFIFSIDQPINKNKYNSSENSIGFLAIEENINNTFFMEFINYLASEFLDINFKLFYTDMNQKLYIEQMFKHIENKELILINNIKNIIENSAIYIHNSTIEINSSYYNDLRYKSSLRQYLFIIDFTLNYKNSHNISDINFIYENNLYFSSSPLFKIFNKHEKFNEFKFLNNLNLLDNQKEYNESYSKDSIGFLVTKENIKNTIFVEYIKEMAIRIPHAKFKVFYYDISEKENINSAFSNFETIYCSSILEISKEIEIFLYTANLTKVYNLIERKLYINLSFISENILCLDINITNKTSLIKDIDLLNKNHSIITKYNYFGINKDVLFEYDFNYTKLFYEYLCKINEVTNTFINENDNAFDFFLITRVSLLLEYYDFKKSYIEISRKLFNV